MRSTVSPQVVTTSNATYRFAADSEIYINSTAIQVDERVWGPDARSFSAQRWLEPGVHPLGPPILKKMPRGTFLPWSGGPRTCPGMKMAQVEFVGTMFEIFQRCRIEPALEQGESVEQARAKLSSLMKDSQPQISLQMKEPEKVRLRWVADLDF